MRHLYLACSLSLLVSSRVVAQGGAAFTADSVVGVSGISALVLKGHVALSEAGEDSVRLLLTIDGSTVIDDGVFCLLCVETVELGPDLSIPATFFAGSGAGVMAIRLSNYATTKSLNVESPLHIVSGSDGATLRKSGAGFLLLQGSARLTGKAGGD